MIKNINFPIKIADTLCESNLKSNCPFTRNRFNISFPASIINNAFTFLFRNILFEICDSLSIREKITRRREIGKEEGGRKIREIRRFRMFRREIEGDRWLFITAVTPPIPFVQGIIVYLPINWQPFSTPTHQFSAHSSVEIWSRSIERTPILEINSWLDR